MRSVEIFNLAKFYPNPYGEPFKAVVDFNLDIQQGEFVGLIGHSGCGKSTVLTMLAGLNEISDGGIVVNGREIDGAGPDRAVVFQSPCLMPWLTAFGNVMLGVKNVYPHASSNQRKQIVESALSAVGLADSMKKYPREMSGGMQQRVGIARAIALKPKLLLLDEPFGRLDSLTRMELQDVMLDILHREKITTVLVSHDVDEVVFLCDRVVMMTNGPAATLGEVLNIDFERPRDRASLLQDPLYFRYLDHLVSFLTERAHLRTEPRHYDSKSLLTFTGKKIESADELSQAVA
ncbi:nitrate/nitrite transport system ATP-binding protein [Haloferula luteola]|uniref:Nitrate/nitrite transport system ATP-binding protein n=1 Tax=Haloferula luteola TaxID=595692 RepID=A0A840VAC0_9BACT|nr:ABC transporter ATP-binding protein [Haloferula luteola]MBB5350729.1 nitrate/nitrite transport system ATP-binding protein [Haloferula luteola]